MHYNALALILAQRIQSDLIRQAEDRRIKGRR